jgi:hypothetical protein
MREEGGAHPWWPGLAGVRPLRRRAGRAQGGAALVCWRKKRGVRGRKNGREGNRRRGVSWVLWDWGQTAGNAVTTLNGAPVTQAEGAE